MFSTRIRYWPVVCALASTTACVSTTSYERDAWQRLDRGVGANATAHASRAELARTEPAAATVELDGTLDTYLAHALSRHPALEAAFAEWRAAVYEIADKRRLPEPTISYGLFLRRVETRVGPQRHRFGLSQMIPWPEKRSAQADAAADMAHAAERRFEAQVTRVKRQVAEAYWSLWQLQKIREIEREQRALLTELAAATRTRIEIGRASLADLTQIDLAVSRRSDAIASLDAREIRAQALLRQVIGAAADASVPLTAEEPAVGLPAESVDALRESAHAHPRVEQFSSMAHASEDQARAADARGLPDFMLGLDYIETGPALNPDVPDSGKDPIIFMLSVSLPLWRGTYDDAERQARARAAAYRARRVEAENTSDSELDIALSRVRESARRIELIEQTLIPQAETSYAAVVGGYQTGATALANVLLAQKSLLELHIELIGERAEHARAWAHLEDVVGRPVAMRANTGGQP